MERKTQKFPQGEFPEKSIKRVVIDMDYIAHHGIKGQKWGVRRFQNYDGTRIKIVEKETKRTQNAYVDHTNSSHPNIKSTTTLYRTSKNKTDLGNGKRELYVTYDEARDRNLYLSWKPYSKEECDHMYEQYMAPVKDLKVASLNAVAKEAYKKYGSEEAVAQKVTEAEFKVRCKAIGFDYEEAKAWNGVPKENSAVVTKALKENRYNTKDRSLIADFYDDDMSDRFGLPFEKRKAKHLSEYKQNPTKCYMDAARAIGSDKKTRLKIEDAFERLGYDAIVDPTGIGIVGPNRNRKASSKTVGSEGRDPLIILSPDKRLRTIQDPKAIDEETRKRAFGVYKSISNRES